MRVAPRGAERGTSCDVRVAVVDEPVDTGVEHTHLDVRTIRGDIGGYVEHDGGDEELSGVSRPRSLRFAPRPIRHTPSAPSRANDAPAHKMGSSGTWSGATPRSRSGYRNPTFVRRCSGVPGPYEPVRRADRSRVTWRRT